MFKCKYRRLLNPLFLCFDLWYVPTYIDRVWLLNNYWSLYHFLIKHEVMFYVAFNFPKIWLLASSPPSFPPTCPCAHRVPTPLVSFSSSNTESVILRQGFGLAVSCLEHFFVSYWSDTASLARLLQASSLRLLGLHDSSATWQTGVCLLIASSTLVSPLAGRI